MTHQDDTNALKERIARAKTERDTWRAAGQEEKYLAAYCTVEALELQLDQQVRAASA